MTINQRYARVLERRVKRRITTASGSHAVVSLNNDSNVIVIYLTLINVSITPSVASVGWLASVDPYSGRVEQQMSSKPDVYICSTELATQSDEPCYFGGLGLHGPWVTGRGRFWCLIGALDHSEQVVKTTNNINDIKGPPARTNHHSAKRL
jgi:hypothetical protein